MSGFIKPQTGGDVDHIDKNDLEGQIVAYKLTDYQDAVETAYGTSARADMHLVMVETGRVDENFAAFGNLGKQLARCVGNEPGKGSIVRIVRGDGQNGKTWWGCDSVSDPEWDEAIKIMNEQKTNPFGEQKTAPANTSDVPF